MINIQPTLVQAMPRLQGIKALILWLEQITGYEYSWSPDHNLSPDALLHAIDDLQFMLPILAMTVRYIDSPDLNALLKELNAVRQREDELHDACVGLSAINTDVERQNAILLAENNRLQHNGSKRQPVRKHWQPNR